jgi:hypothetical protein
MPKHHLLTALTILSASGSAALAQADAPPPTCSPPAVADTADLQPVSGSNLVTVTVAINGTPKQFLLNVGRTPDMISDAASSGLHLPQTNLTTGLDGFSGLNTPTEFRAAMFDVRSGIKPTDYQGRVQASAFTIGTATVQNVIFLVANDRDLGKSKPYDGLLTTAMFSKFDLNLDFGGKKLTFLAPTACQNPVYWPHRVVAVVPMTIVDHKITVPVTIDGRQFDAIIDTSSDRTVMRRGLAEQKFGLKADTADMTPAGDLRDGMGQRVYQHIFPQIAFEGVIAGNVPVLIQTNSMVHKLNREHTLDSRAHFDTDPNDRVADLALGMDVLHQLHIYIAFDQNKIFITPAG